MTSASTDLFSKAKVFTVGLRLRQVETIVVLLWRLGLMLVSVVATFYSVIAIYSYGPQPLTSGFLIAFMIICMVRFEKQLELVQHPHSKDEKQGRHRA